MSVSRPYGAQRLQVKTLWTYRTNQSAHSPILASHAPTQSLTQKRNGDLSGIHDARMGKSLLELDSLFYSLTNVEVSVATHECGIQGHADDGGTVAFMLLNLGLGEFRVELELHPEAQCGMLGLRAACLIVSWPGA